MADYNELKTKKAKEQMIREKVAKDPRWAVRALMVVYANQTADEKQMEATVIHNSIGFSGADAEILSSFAKQVEKGRTLSPKQMAIVHKKMPRYAKQLMAAAAAKAPVDQTEMFRDPAEEEGRKVGPSVNRIRTIRDMHRSECD